MTPEEKADAFINKFLRYEGDDDFENAVIDAKFSIDQIIDQWILVDTYIGNGQEIIKKILKYWKEVKQELEKYETDIT